MLLWKEPTTRAELSWGNMCTMFIPGRSMVHDNDNALLVLFVFIYVYWCSISISDDVRVDSCRVPLEMHELIILSNVSEFLTNLWWGIVLLILIVKRKSWDSGKDRESCLSSGIPTIIRGNGCSPEISTRCSLRAKTMALSKTGYPHVCLLLRTIRVFDWFYTRIEEVVISPIYMQMCSPEIVSVYKVKVNEPSH